MKQKRHGHWQRKHGKAARGKVPRSGRWVLRKGAVLFFCLTLLLTSCGSSKKDAEQELVTVNAYTAKSKLKKEKVEYTGYAFADELKRYSFELSGEIDQILVEKGDKVAAGQLIATLDKSDYQRAVNNAGDNVAMAQESVRQAQNSIDMAQGNVDLAANTVDSAEISSDEAGIGTDSERIALQKINESIEDAKDTLQTIKDTYDTQISSLENVESAEIQKSQSESQENSAEISKSQAEIALDQARIALDQSNDTLNDTELKSTIDGFVVEVPMKAGEVTSAGTPVVLVKSDKDVVNVSIPAEDYPRFSVGMKAKLRQNGVKAKGRITSIDLYPDESTRTYNMEITPEEGTEFAMGSLVSVKIAVGKLDSISVPLSAVFNQDDIDYVYTLKENEDGNYIVSSRQVKIEKPDGENVMVSGLKPGEMIARDEVKYLHDNQIVQLETEKENDQ